ncbi:MAG: sugar ABC transporter permease [bacterium]|nr:sugar ABC transporter permease [bacterium]
MKRFFNRLTSSETVAGYTFLLPNFLGFLLFTSLPVLASLVLSFMDWDILTPPKFAGISNFVTLFHDKLFWQYVGNTLYLMANIPITMVGALLVALLMNQKLRGIVIYRTIYFLPSVCSGVAVCLLWRWLYNPDFGLINTMLGQIGIQGPDWLSSTTWAKPALMLMGLWGAVGGMNMILYLAALQGVPPELYEAAEIDGANAWQKFKAITLPFLSPTTFFIGIMAVIHGFQGGFMSAFIMTNGGPAGSTTTIEYYIYNNAYQWFKMGYAASIAWVLFIVVLIITLFNWRFGGKLVQYN